MSNTLIDKLSKMERDSIIKNDSRVAQSIFNLTKKSKEKEDNNLKFVQIKGLSAPSEYQFKKLFNDLYTDITDAESAFVSGQQTQEKTYGLIILKKYNILCQYITRVLKYNSMTQSNKDEINNTMDTILPHLNNILSVIDIGYATLSRQYGEPVFNDIPIYKNIKENIQSRIYSQISRETMKYEIDPVEDIEINPREFYEDEDEEDDNEEYINMADYEEIKNDDNIPYEEQPEEKYYYSSLMNNNEPERLFRSFFEEPEQYENYDEPQRLQYENYEEPQRLQYEEYKEPLQIEEYDDNYEQRADKQRERNLLKKTVSELKKRAKPGAKENLKLVNDELKKLGDNYKLKPYGYIIKERLEEVRRLGKRQTSSEYNKQILKEKLKEKNALNTIINFLKRGIRNRKKKNIKEPELDELDKALEGEIEIDDLDINELNNKAKQRAINRLMTKVSTRKQNEKKKTNDKFKEVLEGIKTGMLLVPRPPPRGESSTEKVKKELVKEKFRKEMEKEGNLFDMLEKNDMEKLKPALERIFKSVNISPRIISTGRMTPAIPTIGRPAIQLRIEEKEEKEKKEKKVVPHGNVAQWISRNRKYIETPKNILDIKDGLNRRAEEQRYRVAVYNKLKGEDLTEKITGNGRRKK